MNAPLRIRTLIVDDEPIARQTLKEYCALENDVEVVGECRYGAEAVKRIAALKPDLVFLDVQMRRVNGLEVIEKIGREAMPLVIFVTAYDQYAVDAFELNAVDYLLKPFDRERFRAALDRARSRIANPGAADVRAQVQAAVRQMLGSLGGLPGNTPKRIVAEKNDRYIFVDPADVHAVEASRNYITLHVGNERLLLRCGMQQAESMLDPAMFLRIHRSVIVNTRHIKEMARQLYGDYEVTLSNGTKFSSGRAYRRRVVNYLNSGRF
ncbi:MAG TPA: LytTR family DNA-binding domain-containing protein [Steroidobacteraceae bacterium]|nr:LytTR family DNA-binding domain-containing protein [Steroidobacteraceae bacterium]